MKLLIGIPAVALFLAYVGFTWYAGYIGFTELLDRPWDVLAFAAMILLAPLQGLIGIPAAYGAYEAWNWNLVVAILVFFWPPLAVMGWVIFKLIPVWSK